MNCKAYKCALVQFSHLSEKRKNTFVSIILKPAIIGDTYIILLSIIIILKYVHLGR